MRFSLPIVLLLACFCWPSAAQSATSTDELLQLLKARPSKMRKSTWRTQRREAAKELGRRKESRAVPILLTIVRKERIDVILEVAIQALGRIGDSRAVKPLRKLLDDPTLDSYAREAVSSALERLERRRPKPPKSDPPKNGSPTRTPSKSPRTQSDSPARRPDTETPARRTGGFDDVKPEPRVEDPQLAAADLLGISDRFDIIFGNGNFRWEGAADTAELDLSLATRYRRQLEKRTWAYTVDILASAGYQLVDPATGDKSWLLSAAGQLQGEFRYYPLSGRYTRNLFVQGSLGLGYSIGWVSPAVALDNRFVASFTITPALAFGYGRLYDIGSQLRLKRIERVLRKAQLLSGPITLAQARQLLRAWYRVRNVVGNYKALANTLRILGIQDTVDAATAYRLIRILDDGQLFDRRSGLLIRAGYGYAQTVVKDADNANFGFAFLTGSYYRQFGTARQLTSDLRFFFNHLGDANTFSLDLRATHDWFLYTSAFDPVGAIGLTARGGISKQGSGFSDAGIGYQVLGGASYTRVFERATRLIARLEGGVAFRSPIVLLSLELQFGINQASIALGK